MSDTAPNELHASLCTQVNFQIEAMCTAMLKAALQDVETLPYLVQSLAIRINALNDAMMHAMHGDPEMVENLRFEVYGLRSEVAHA